jgi:hypothetical protein
MSNDEIRNKFECQIRKKGTFAVPSGILRLRLWPHIRLAEIEDEEENEDEND